MHIFYIRCHNPFQDYIILIYPPCTGYGGNSCKYKTPLSNSFVYVLIDVVSGSFRVHFDNFVAMGKQNMQAKKVKSHLQAAFSMQHMVISLFLKTRKFHPQFSLKANCG